jgi:NarL family two-component system sensor histidine kinase LiaS
MRLLRSFSYQVLISHVGVALLTTFSLVAVFIMIVNQGITLREYQIRSMIDYTAWQFDDPRIFDTFSFDPPGYGLIINEEGQVIFTVGDSPCVLGNTLGSCAPALDGASAGSSFFDHNGERWAQVIIDSKSGQRVLSQRGPYVTTLNFGETNITGYAPIFFAVSLVTAIIALPIAVIFTFILARPQVRRIGHITHVSSEFAGGDLDIRVHDTHTDEMGQLGQQFDDMADTLQQNFATLRELAQRNADLAQQVEQSAIQSERIRLSRDLHDSIAQHLFSLSVSTRALPDIIESDKERGAAEAEKLADLAEQTLQDLRSVLVDLRPAAVITEGIAPALRKLCADWQDQNQIPLNYTILLSGDHIPSAIEDVLFRVTQEALSNVARYAQASNAAVTLVEGRHHISLSISDDGIGFDPQGRQAEGHFGIIGMRERVMAVGGQFSIDSDSRGTTIETTIRVKGLSK